VHDKGFNGILEFRPERFRAINLFAILVVLCGIAFGQVSSSIRGTVIDANGDRVRDASVTLKAAGGTYKADSTTGDDGVFDFQGLAPGRYLLEIRAVSFKTLTKRIEIKAGDSFNSEFRVEIDDTRVTVTAEIGQSSLIDDVPQDLNVVTSDELKERQVTVLAQAAEAETGLNVQTTSPTLGAIVVRGLTGKNVVNYIDGVRFTHAGQRGGINTFFNLNDASNLRSIEVLRGPDSAQYGSDSLGGTVNLVTRTPVFGGDRSEVHGEFNSGYSSANRGLSSSATISYGRKQYGAQLNIYGRRSNTLRTADGIDSHSAITRFLGLPSTILYNRLPDTEFTQYGGSLRFDATVRESDHVAFYYQRGQQDDGKRFDHLIGGNGNLVADLRNLMSDFAYLRYSGGEIGFIDSGSVTISYNTQREERVNQGGQGNPLADIIHHYERTSVLGASFFLSRAFSGHNSIVLGGEFYSEKVNAPAFTYRPSDGTFITSRPRVPDEAGFNFGGIYAQGVWAAVPERLRVSGAIRYSGGRYKARAADSPIVNGVKLWKDDDFSEDDFSGRIGAVLSVTEQLRLAVNYSRGFRFPSMTDLGTLGLTGDGFEIDFSAAAGLGGTIGSTAGADAVDTGIPVSKQRPEISSNLDLKLRFQSGRFETSFTYFQLLLADTIVKQSLILPPGSVGGFLGDQPIISQLSNGVVFVPVSADPVLVRANFNDARLRGVEYDALWRLNEDFETSFGYTYIKAEDKETGIPPNIEGGTPPPNGFFKISYRPSGQRFWIDGLAIMAQRQDRLSSLDLGDRRTGSPRNLSQIANFFQRGACVRGLTNNPDGVCGTGDETILLATGESVADVQIRVLGGASASILFPYLPGYVVVKLRGGIKISERSTLYLAAENIFDQFHRNPSWGVDGAGRGFRVGYRFSF